MGTNGKVNVALNAQQSFGVSCPAPLHPYASTRAVTYEWSKTAPSGSWPYDGPEPSHSFSWSSAGTYTLYCRMVDANGVGTLPLEIPVRVWEQPEVDDTPPANATVYWGGASPERLVRQ